MSWLGHHPESIPVKVHSIFLAAPLWCALSATTAQAESSASASLNLSVQSATGFAWVAADPASATTTDASASELTGWTLSAGVFSPVYGPASQASQTLIGPAIQLTAAGAAAGTALGNGSSGLAGQGNNFIFSARAEVGTEGKADATSFARSWFTLDAGASVTFQGLLLVGLAGTNPSLPASYNTGDFYSFASGLLAVGSQVLSVEFGGPLTTGLVGGYTLNDVMPWSLTVTNPEATALLTYLDSGITVYSASAVPEPGTYLLLFAGLLGVAWTVSRQAQQR